MTFAPREATERVARALDAELGLLRGRRAPALPLRSLRLPAAAPTPLPRLAVVAADAGNLELRLHPLRVGVVRLGTSRSPLPVGEVFVPLSLPVDRLVRWVLEEPSLAHLRDAATCCGLDPEQAASWLPPRLDSTYVLHFLRELLEWLLLVAEAQKAPPGTLLLRDGLLRSVALPREAFRPLCEALRRLTTERRLFLCALAKRVPGGVEFLSYLELVVGELFCGDGMQACEVPPAVEEQFSPASYASARGRRAGALYLLAPSPSQRHRPLAVEIPLWQQGHAADLLAALQQHGHGGYPVPGYPAELLAAHQAAHVSPLQRELLVHTFLRRLGEQRRELREQLLAAHLGGSALVLDPMYQQEAP